MSRESTGVGLAVADVMDRSTWAYSFLQPSWLPEALVDVPWFLSSVRCKVLKSSAKRSSELAQLSLSKEVRLSSFWPVTLALSPLARLLGFFVYLSYFVCWEKARPVRCA